MPSGDDVDSFPRSSHGICSQVHDIVHILSPDLISSQDSLDENGDLLLQRALRLRVEDVILPVYAESLDDGDGFDVPPDRIEQPLPPLL